MSDAEAIRSWQATFRACVDTLAAKYPNARRSELIEELIEMADLIVPRRVDLGNMSAETAEWYCALLHNELELARTAELAHGRG